MLMERLYSQTLNLQKVRAQVLNYSRELCPALLDQSEDTQSERDALESVYRHLHSLHLAMAKDLAELEILLALSTQTSATKPLHRMDAPQINCLSCKENEVLNVFAKGYSYSEAARLLDCKLATIQTHAKRIYKKLKVHSRSEAVFEAHQMINS